MRFDKRGLQRGLDKTMEQGKGLAGSLVIMKQMKQMKQYERVSKALARFEQAAQKAIDSVDDATVIRL